MRGMTSIHVFENFTPFYSHFESRAKRLCALRLPHLCTGSLRVCTHSFSTYSQRRDNASQSGQVVADRALSGAGGDFLLNRSVH